MPISSSDRLAFLSVVIPVILVLAGCGSGGGSSVNLETSADMISNTVSGPGNKLGTGTNATPVASTGSVRTPGPAVSPDTSSNSVPVTYTDSDGSTLPAGGFSLTGQETSVERTDSDSYGNWLNTQFKDYGMNFVQRGEEYDFQQGQSADLRVYHPESSSNFDGATFAGVVAGKVRDTEVQKSGTVTISFTADGLGASDFSLDVSGIDELVDMSGHITAGTSLGSRYWRILETTYGSRGGQSHSQRIDANFYNRNRLVGEIESWTGDDGGFVGFIGTKKQY